MVSKVLLLSCFLLLCDAAFEGDKCTKDGKVGTCEMIAKCKSAIEDLKNRINPKICGFVLSDPIVCCLDKVVQTIPVATTTARPPVTTTSREPPVYDYTGDNADRVQQCEALASNMTAKRTGQKAFDKCIDYQDQLVYPCERSVALTGEMNRGSHCHHDADGLIVGGVDAGKDEFPHMVMLGYGDDPKNLQWLCGGAIISSRFILTAGHCVASRDFGVASYVLVGALLRSDAQIEANRYKVKRYIKHPEYKPPIKYNDIALLELENAIKLSQYVVPACLHVGDPVKDDSVLATGWGLTQYKGSTSDILQKVILHKFTEEECSLKYPVNRLMRNGFDPETMVCYGDKTKEKDTCQGDSGGPIQIKSKKIHCMYVIVGVTSFGRGCGFPGEPAIYTRVSHYVPWIESVVWP